jgi:hypothetical protein
MPGKSLEAKLLGSSNLTLDLEIYQHLVSLKHVIYIIMLIRYTGCYSNTIMFGDNSEGKVFGYGKIAITTDHSISKVLLVDSLDYNLLSVSQLCEMCYNYLFTNKGGTVFRSDGSYAFSGILRGKLYLVNFNPK